MECDSRHQAYSDEGRISCPECSRVLDLIGNEFYDMMTGGVKS